MEINDLLELLINEQTVSGNEKNNYRALEKLFSPIVDKISYDNLGNVIMEKKGFKKKIMIDAHFDEIGLMITDILDNGYLKFSNLGGMNPSVLIAQEVIIKGKEDIIGVIGIKDRGVSTLEEINAPIKIENLLIDTGRNKEDIQKLVSKGNGAVINRNINELQNQFVTGRGLDNKASICVLYQIANALKEKSINSNIYYVATAQEEVGLRGATTAAYNINPDIAIVIDVGQGYTPELTGNGFMELGKGPGIAKGANMHPTLVDRIMSIANNNNFDYQMRVAPVRTGTNAQAIQVTRQGIPCISISIPLRFMHTSVEVINKKDIDNASKIVTKFIEQIEDLSLEELLCF